MTKTKTNIKTNIKYPKKYLVIILNDDHSTFDFVISTLMRIFDKTLEEAKIITNKVHNEDKGICGIYPKQIAELKMNESNEYAKINKQPLKTIMMPEGE